MSNYCTTLSAEIPVNYHSLDFLGFPGYRVGDDGSIWSSLRAGSKREWPWRELYASPQCNGYLRVTLYNTDGFKRFYVHTLVLLAFVGPCPAGMECRHLDGNQKNNLLDNICWGTYLENAADMRRHGRFHYGDQHWSRKQPESVARGCRHWSYTHPERVARGEKNASSKLTADNVRLLRRLSRDEGWTARALANRFGVHRATIQDAIHRRTWRHIND
jgi:hypothetical protein